MQHLRFRCSLEQKIGEDCTRIQGLRASTTPTGPDMLELPGMTPRSQNPPNHNEVLAAGNSHSYPIDVNGSSPPRRLNPVGPRSNEQWSPRIRNYPRPRSDLLAVPKSNYSRLAEFSHTKNARNVPQTKTPLSKTKARAQNFKHFPVFLMRVEVVADSVVH